MLRPPLTPILLALLATVSLLACQDDTTLVENQGHLGPGPVVVEDRLYILTSQYDIAFGALSVDLSAGRIDWIQPNAGFETCQGLSADSDGVYVVCGSLLSLLDPGTGNVRWRVELPSAPKDAPIPLGDRIALRIDTAPGEIRSAGPDHGPMVSAMGEDSTLYSVGSNPEAYVWRWMADIPHAYAWAWMAMEEIHPNSGEAPSLEAREAMATPSEDAPKLGPPGDFLQATPSPTPTPEDLMRTLIIGKEKGLLLAELKGVRGAPMAPFSGSIVWARRQEIQALSPQDGRVVWRHPKGPGPTELSSEEPHLLVIQANSLQCLSTEGQLAWEVDTLGWVTPIVSDGIVLYLQGGALVARSIRDGALRWEHSAVGVVDRPVVEGGIIALKTVGGTIRLWDLKTGAETLSFEAGARGRLVLGTSRLYWIAQDGIYSLRLGEGEDPERMELPEDLNLDALQGGFSLKERTPVIREDALILTLKEGRILKLVP